MSLFRLKRSFVLPVAVMLGLLLLWELVVKIFAIPVYLLPAPSEIWRETAAIPARLFDNTLATLMTVLGGFAVAIVISLPIAVLIVYSRWFADAVYPLLVFTQSIPKVALA